MPTVSRGLQIGCVPPVVPCSGWLSAAPSAAATAPADSTQLSAGYLPAFSDRSSKRNAGGLRFKAFLCTLKTKYVSDCDSGDIKLPVHTPIQRDRVTAGLGTGWEG